MDKKGCFYEIAREHNKLNETSWTYILLQLSMSILQFAILNQTQYFLNS